MQKKILDEEIVKILNKSEIHIPNCPFCLKLQYGPSNMFGQVLLLE